MTRQEKNNFYEALKRKQHGSDIDWLVEASLINPSVIIIVGTQDDIGRFRRRYNELFSKMSLLDKIWRLFFYKGRKPKVVSLDHVGYGLKIPKIYSQSAVERLLEEPQENCPMCSVYVGQNLINKKTGKRLYRVCPTCSKELPKI